MSKYPKSFFLDVKHNKQNNQNINLVLNDLNNNDITPKPDFDLAGHYFSVYEPMDSFEPLIHCVYSNEAVLHKHTISFKPVMPGCGKEILFDPKNSCFFCFIKSYSHCIDIYGTFFDDLTKAPNLSLIHI